MNKKKKVILFFPIINPATKFHWFPFSLLALGAMLKKTDVVPIVIDERITPDYVGQMKQHLADAICVGISAFTGYQIKGGLNFAKWVKEKQPTLPIVWGGRHATLLTKETVENEWVDIVVKSQGEVTFLELVNALARNESFENLSGIAYKINGNIVENADRPLVDVNQLNAFDWSLVNIPDYINSETRAFAYVSSFGCPARCGFCSNSWSVRRWMSLDTNFVLNDLEKLIKQHNFVNLMFQDSNYFVSENRVNLLADGFIKREFDIKWKASVRADQFWKYEDETLRKAEKSGLISLFIGIESGSQKILDLITKDTTTADAIKTVLKAKKYSFEVHASFMFGLPYETLNDLKATIDHVQKLKEVNPNIKIQTCFYSPFPNTSLFTMAKELGFKPPRGLEEWQHIKDQVEFATPFWFDPDMAEEYRETFLKAFPENAVTKF